MLDRGVRIALLPLDARQLAVEKRAVRRRRNRSRVAGNRLVGLARSRSLPRPRDILLGYAEFQHVDAAFDVGERGIDDERRLEGADRVGLAVERNERLTTT